MPSTYYSEISASKVTVGRLIISSSALCTPDESTPGTYGQMVVCENYVYVHDGTKWKRVEIAVYLP